jgi:transcriptional regulator of aromatic amino acid metabolism
LIIDAISSRPPPDDVFRGGQTLNLKIVDSMQNEIGSLAENQRTLLETTPEMVLSINSNGTLEDMNPPSVTYVGNCEAQAQNTQFVPQIGNILLARLSELKAPSPQINKFRNELLKCRIEPLTGYNCDKIFWGSF